MVSPLGILGRGADAAIAVIQISSAFGILKICCELPVVFAARSIWPAGAFALPEPPARVDFLERAFRVRGDGMAIAGINRETVCRVAHQQYAVLLPSQRLHQTCRQAMIMVSPGRLYVSVVQVQAQVNEA